MKLVFGSEFPSVPPKGMQWYRQSRKLEREIRKCSWQSQWWVPGVSVLITQSMCPILCAGYFLTKIFHPNVSNTGEICVNVLKRDWTPTLGLRHVLTVIRCLLIEPNPESALNEEAGKLLLEAYDDFAKHARLMTSIHARK